MEHTITPPTELVQRLCNAAFLPGADGASRGEIEVSLILEAFAAGADQELEACCAEVSWFTADKLRAARRPKPLSLKESALNALEHILRHSQTDHGANTIRRALEALPND